MEPVLRARKIKKSFYTPSPTVILDEISLEIFPGESIAVTGKSGVGKSTLLHILGTLDSPCAGSLEIASRPVGFFSKNRIRNRHIAFVFQSFHLLEDYTALENVLMPARIGRSPTGRHSESYRKGVALLEETGLGERIHCQAKFLSGGEKQRVAIARALCNEPDLILADEPSGNLDQETSSRIHTLLIDYAHRRRKALLVVTHNPEFASLCLREYEIAHGRLHSVR